MTPEQVTHYKDLLLQEKSALEKELQSLGHRTENNSDWVATPPPQDEAAPDHVDQADYVEDFEARIGELSVIETHYQDVLEALKKIDAGTYGICEISGQPIETDRLDAYPGARTCKAHMNTAL
jgi:RNA polymerase-binding transcription factor DksA